MKFHGYRHRVTSGVGTQIVSGKVVAMIGNRNARIRLSGGNQSTLCDVPDGITVCSGMVVSVARYPGASRPVVVASSSTSGSVVDAISFQAISEGGADVTISVPTALETLGINSGVLFRWDCPVVGDQLFIVQENDSASETGAEQFVISGGVHVSTRTYTGYFRVCAVIALADGTTIRSEWSSWISGTPLSDLATEIDEVQLLLEYHIRTGL